MVEEPHSGRRYTAGNIVRETIKIVVDNAFYFLLLTAIGWTAQETLGLLTGQRSLFESIPHDLRHVAWASLLWDGLNGLIGSVFSSAIVLRAHANFLGKKKEWRREWSEVFQSGPSLMLYALVFVAIQAPFLFLTEILSLTGTQYAGPFLILIIVSAVIIALVVLAWSLVIPVIVIEQRSVLGALRRSDLLTRRRRGTIFAVFILFAICFRTPEVLVDLALHQEQISHTTPALISLPGILAAALSIIGAMFSGAGIGVIYDLILETVPITTESERL